MPVRWCCLAFHDHYLEAGERTFSVLIDQEASGDPLFILQHRTLNPEDRLPALPIPVSVVTEVRISFCPWCGRRLARWYKRWVTELRNPKFRIHTE